MANGRVWQLLPLPDVRLNRREWLPCFAEWTNGVRPDSSGNDKGFRIVNLEWRECAGRAFNERSLTLYQIENVEISISIVKHSAGEPVAAGLQKL